MNKLATFLLTGALAIASIAPTAVAASGDARNFCSRISSREAALEVAETRREAALAEMQEDRLARIARNRAEQDRIRDARGAEADAALESRIDRFEARARTQAQRDAIVAYRNAIVAAQNARRAAVDSAYGIFRTGMDALIASRQSAMRTAQSALFADIDAAIARAKSDCAARVSAATVQEHFRSDLSAARTRFATAKQNLPQIESQLAALRITRDASLLFAKNVFKAVSAIARAALDRAL